MNQWTKQQQQQQGNINNPGQSSGGQANLLNNLYGQLYGFTGTTGNTSPVFGGGAYGQGQQERGNIISGYNQLAQGLSPGTVSNLQNISTPRINAQPGYQALTGYNPQFNLDPTLTQGELGNIKSLQNLSWNPQDVATARGAIQGLTGNIAGFQNFADTGGLTAQDQANFRARSNAPVGAYYSQQQSELERLGNQAQGNPYALAAARANLARGGSQALADVSQGTESNLTNLINQYKMAGLGGVQQGLATQAGLANQLAQGQAATELYGLTGALQGQQQLQGQQLGAQQAAAQLGLQGRLAGLAGLSEADRANLAAQQEANQLYAQNQRFIGSTNLGAQESALSGLRGLYGTAYAPATELQRQLLGQFNAGDAAQRDYLRLLLGGMGIPSAGQQVFGNILGGVGAGVGALTGLSGIPGIAGLFGGGTPGGGGGYQAGVPSGGFAQ